MAEHTWHCFVWWLSEQCKGAHSYAASQSHTANPFKHDVCLLMSCCCMVLNIGKLCCNNESRHVKSAGKTGYTIAEAIVVTGTGQIYITCKVCCVPVVQQNVVVYRCAVFTTSRPSHHQQPWRKHTLSANAECLLRQFRATSV